jgi:hydrogenase maturation factor
MRKVGGVMDAIYPVQVLAIQPGELALVETEGRLQEVALCGLADPVVIAGDWLLVRAGVALSRIEPDEAYRRRLGS